MSAEEIAKRYRLGRFAELTLEQAGDERGYAIKRPDVAEAGVKRTVDVQINAPRVGEFLARAQHPVFKQAARILERSVPEEKGFGRFRDNTKDEARCSTASSLRQACGTELLAAQGATCRPGLELED